MEKLVSKKQFQINHANHLNNKGWQKKIRVSHFHAASRNQNLTFGLLKFNLNLST